MPEHLFGIESRIPLLVVEFIRKNSLQLAEGGKR
jgi:hypothetical protein